ncbi:Uncharacterized protein QTN25_005502 [Entamoeba marina]
MSLKLPRLLKSDTPTQKKVASINCNCLLCQRGFIQYHRKPTWNTILRVVFYCLKKVQPLKEYFNLNNDIYVFIENHNHIFSRFKHFEQKPQVWKKAMIDALSHSKSFSTGFPIYGINGYWKLKNEEDPWKSSFPDKVNNQSWNWLKSIPDTTCVLEKTIPSSGRNSPESRCVSTPVHMLEPKKSMQRFVIPGNSYKKTLQPDFGSYHYVQPVNDLIQVEDIKQQFDNLNHGMMMSFQDGVHSNENGYTTTCDEAEINYVQTQNENFDNANELTNDTNTQPTNYTQDIDINNYCGPYDCTNQMIEDDEQLLNKNEISEGNNEEVAMAECEENKTTSKVEVGQKDENKEEQFISFENKGFMMNPSDFCYEESFISHNYY